MCAMQINDVIVADPSNDAIPPEPKQEKLGTVANNLHRACRKPGPAIESGMLIGT